MVSSDYLMNGYYYYYIFIIYLCFVLHSFACHLQQHAITVLFTPFVGRDFGPFGIPAVIMKVVEAKCH